MTQVKSQQETSQELVNTSSNKGQELDQDAHKLLISEMRKAIQPDIDALHRSIHRQEKRTSTSSFETGSRLRKLEARSYSLGSQVDAMRKDGSQGLMSRLSHVVWTATIMPFQAFLVTTAHITRIISWPFHILLRLVESKKSHSKRSSGYSKSL